MYITGRNHPPHEWPGPGRRPFFFVISYDLEHNLLFLKGKMGQALRGLFPAAGERGDCGTVPLSRSKPF